MRVAIATDIHGNRHAFEAVIAAAEADGAEELWCLGDLVGYGGDPDASVALARANCSVCLAGNHDLAVVDVLSLEEFSRGAALAAQWTREVIQPDTREYLLSLDPQGSAEGIGLFHASPRDPIWEYVLSGLTAELCFDATDFRISLIGHSHVALSFDRQEGSPAAGTTRKEGTELDLESGRWLINPGSTGQPRDGDPRAAWLMLDTERLTATYRRAEYDIAGAMAAIRAANLPDSLAERLQHGQ
jgi:diadenosine tetraphosphatase ApaH/serine/threonine PP2A family protein phosphatase